MRKTQNAKQLSVLWHPHQRPLTWEWKFQRLLSYEHISCLFNFKDVLLPSFQLIKHYFVLSSEKSTKRQFLHQSILWGLKLWTSPCQSNRLIYELWIRKLSLFLCMCINSANLFFSYQAGVTRALLERPNRQQRKMDHQMFWIVLFVFLTFD